MLSYFTISIKALLGYNQVGYQCIREITKTYHYTAKYFHCMVTPIFFLQLNFAKYKRSGKFGYKMVPPGKMQVPGFCNSDLYQDVIAKGAKGLGITVCSENLSLIVSNG